MMPDQLLYNLALAKAAAHHHYRPLTRDEVLRETEHRGRPLLSSLAGILSPTIGGSLASAGFAANSAKRLGQDPAEAGLSAGIRSGVRGLASRLAGSYIGQAIPAALALHGSGAAPLAASIPMALLGGHVGAMLGHHRAMTSSLRDIRERGLENAAPTMGHALGMFGPQQAPPARPPMGKLERAGRFIAEEGQPFGSLGLALAGHPLLGAGLMATPQRHVSQAGAEAGSIGDEMARQRDMRDQHPGGPK